MYDAKIVFKILQSLKLTTTQQIVQTVTLMMRQNKDGVLKISAISRLTLITYHACDHTVVQPHSQAFPTKNVVSLGTKLTLVCLVADCCYKINITVFDCVPQPLLRVLNPIQCDSDYCSLYCSLYQACSQCELHQYASIFPFRLFSADKKLQGYS